MNIFYWNINRALTDKKLDWINKAITDKSPDIFCLAEGPESADDCISLVDFISQKGYYSYYNPTLYKEKVISNQYEWNRNGLKVFVKSKFILNSKFSFSNQQLEGRIIYLRFQIGTDKLSLFLIHGMSKAGDDIDQNDFIAELSRFIHSKTLKKEDDKVIILGDFNIEPWDDLLRKKKYIHSFFYKKLFDYQQNTIKKRIFSSPVFEYIQSHSNVDLIGTFYNSSYTSLLDFPLISGKLNDFDFQILTQLSGIKLLEKKNTKNLIVDGLDHLPISLKIN
jgi:exonuclease III